MKAILSKEGGGYDLYRIDEDGKRVTFASTQDYKQKLSIKNCQAIERGYDLDELVEIDLVKEKDLDFTDESSFRRGFLKALEILGDKKFSEEKMKLFAEYVWKEVRSGRMKSMDELFNDWTSPQQTEWEVEIEMEDNDKIELSYGATSIKDSDYILRTQYIKLDTDGCLILKRI